MKLELLTPDQLMKLVQSPVSAGERMAAMFELDRRSKMSNASVEPQNYAGGGLVSFAAGTPDGTVDSFIDRTPEDSGLRMLRNLFSNGGAGFSDALGRFQRALSSGPTERGDTGGAQAQPTAVPQGVPQPKPAGPAIDPSALTAAPQRATPAQGGGLGGSVSARVSGVSSTPGTKGIDQYLQELGPAPQVKAPSMQDITTAIGQLPKDMRIDFSEEREGYNKQRKSAESDLNDAKWLALLQAGGKMMETPGGLGRALGAGIGTGLAGYRQYGNDAQARIAAANKGLADIARTNVRDNRDLYNTGLGLVQAQRQADWNNAQADASRRKDAVTMRQQDRMLDKQLAALAAKQAGAGAGGANWANILSSPAMADKLAAREAADPQMTLINAKLKAFMDATKGDPNAAQRPAFQQLQEAQQARRLQLRDEFMDYLSGGYFNKKDPTRPQSPLPAGAVDFRSK